MPKEAEIVVEVPRTREQIAAFVESRFGVHIPSKPLCDHHDSPLEYLAASFLRQEDLVVWANRGGGKTYLAAIGTLMDTVFRAPLQVLVLGGSFDQSDRLAEYIRQLLLEHSHLVRGRITRQRVKLVGGSEIRMLAQSQQAVRGQHVQKIRCDEVDLFDADIWRAVQFATRSKGRTRGAIEVLSTLHRPNGLMQRLVQQATAISAKDDPSSGRNLRAGFRLIKWCLWDVIERCPSWRKCSDCILAEDCRGVARRGEGFFRIDDAIAIKARSSRAAWEAEMLCKGARVDDLVFPEFDLSRHVQAIEYVPDWPLYRAIDFGYRSPLVCLWVQLSPGGRVHVLDEYVRARLPLAQHVAAILSQPSLGREPVARTYVDPAGRQKESTSGAACTEMLAAAGIPCAWRASTIGEGLELVRSALAPAFGEPTLAIHSRCKGIVRAFQSYHYDSDGPTRAVEAPVKDGPDHYIDALRYFFVNRCRPASPVRRGRY